MFTHPTWRKFFLFSLTGRTLSEDLVTAIEDRNPLVLSERMKRAGEVKNNFFFQGRALKSLSSIHYFFLFSSPVISSLEATAKLWIFRFPFLFQSEQSFFSFAKNSEFWKSPSTCFHWDFIPQPGGSGLPLRFVTEGWGFLVTYRDSLDLLFSCAQTHFMPRLPYRSGLHHRLA